MSDYISIGKIVAVHGLKGELVLKHRLGNKANLREVKVLFTEEHKNAYLPWFIQQVQIKNQEELLIKLDGVDTPEAAKKFNQKIIWLRKEDFNKQVSKSATISLIGYTIINEKKFLGLIMEIVEQPHQTLCMVDMNGKEIYIPLHRDFIQKIDRQKKQIHVILPDGLLELYM